MYIITQGFLGRGLVAQGYVPSSSGPGGPFALSCTFEGAPGGSGALSATFESAPGGSGSLSATVEPA
jgi:hypothetical protein